MKRTATILAREGEWLYAGLTAETADFAAIRTAKGEYDVIKNRSGETPTGLSALQMHQVMAAAIGEPAEGYHVVCFRHKSIMGPHVLFWAPNENGYTDDLAFAGVYTKEQAEGCCKDGDVAVPVSLFRHFATRTILDLDHSTNGPLRNANALVKYMKHENIPVVEVFTPITPNS